LQSIKAVAPVQRFLQGWDALKRRLGYGVGDGKRGVIVHSDGEVTEATGGIVATRLTPQLVERWPNAPTVGTQNLLTRIGSTLNRYVHFEDGRLYLLLSLWIAGTYVYSIFGHYGYLHLHSVKKRSGKTRALEVTQHLAFEGTPPVNAPTAPVVREIATRGSSNFFDTLEPWRKKSEEAFSAMMDLLDAGFRKGGRVSKMVKSDGQWREESFDVTPHFLGHTMQFRRPQRPHVARVFPVDSHRTLLEPPFGQESVNLGRLEVDSVALQQDVQFGRHGDEGRIVIRTGVFDERRNDAALTGVLCGFRVTPHLLGELFEGGHRFLVQTGE
jgi:hypothetical protein